MKYLILGMWVTPILSYAMSFNTLTERAYDVSGEMIQKAGYANAIPYEKASALAHDPLRIEGSARKIRGDDPVDSGMEYGAMVDFSVKMPGFRNAQGREYDLLSSMAEHEIKSEQGRIQVALKRDWLLAELEREKVKILTQKLALSRDAYTIGSKKNQAGRMSQMELLRLETERHNAEQEYAAARMEYEHAQHRLKEAIMSHEEVVVDDLSFAFVSKEQVHERIDKALMIQTLNLRIEELDAQIETTRRSTFESLSMGIGMTREPTQNSADFRVSIPLSWSEKNEKKIAALMSERSALVQRRDVSTQRLRLSVDALSDHLAEREQRIKEIVSTEKQYETLFTMAHKGLEGGVVTQFEYLSTKNAFYDHRLRALELKRSYIEEMSTIEEKIGGIL
ncbi:TolC family protein [Sulfuricurvum sp.]|uniref:TolC family protein n=1 Tax=Sulfuricurvum sp. TaxID=2025608 RepID=UPI003C3A3ABE